MMKPKVAFFDFAGCEGDQLQIANLEEDLLALLGQVDVVSFREVMKEQSDNYDIAFVEGSCTRLEDEDRLKQIRKNAKIGGRGINQINVSIVMKSPDTVIVIRYSLFGSRATHVFRIPIHDSQILSPLHQIKIIGDHRISSAIHRNYQRQTHSHF